MTIPGTGHRFRLPQPAKGKGRGGGPWSALASRLRQREVGIPSLTTENIRGIKNVMRHVSMLDEPPEKQECILTYDRSIGVNPAVGGLLLPERERDTVLCEVRKGELLGRVISPYTFEELEARGALRELADMGSTFSPNPF